MRERRRPDEEPDIFEGELGEQLIKAEDSMRQYILFPGTKLAPPQNIVTPDEQLKKLYEKLHTIPRTAHRDKTAPEYQEYLNTLCEMMNVTVGKISDLEHSKNFLSKDDIDVGDTLKERVARIDAALRWLQGQQEDYEKELDLALSASSQEADSLEIQMITNTGAAVVPMSADGRWLRLEKMGKSLENDHRQTTQSVSLTLSPNYFNKRFPKLNVFQRLHKKNKKMGHQHLYELAQTESIKLVPINVGSQFYLRIIKKESAPLTRPEIEKPDSKERYNTSPLSEMSDQAS